MLAVLIYTFSHAQTYSITGTLRDAKSGEPFFNVDFGLSTDLFDRHLSLYFQVNDLFQSYNSHTVSTNPYYAEDYRWSYNSRFVSLGLTWRIGKMDLESKGRQGAAY